MDLLNEMSRYVLFVYGIVERKLFPDPFCSIYFRADFKKWILEVKYIKFMKN